MAKKFSIQLVQKELDKIEHPTELLSAYNDIKKYLTEKLAAAQKEAEEKANDLQSQIQKINGN